MSALAALIPCKGSSGLSASPRPASYKGHGLPQHDIMSSCAHLLLLEHWPQYGPRSHAGAESPAQGCPHEKCQYDACHRLPAGGDTQHSPPDAKISPLFGSPLHPRLFRTPHPPPTCCERTAVKACDAFQLTSHVPGKAQAPHVQAQRLCPVIVKACALPGLQDRIAASQRSDHLWYS